MSSQNGQPSNVTPILPAFAAEIDIPSRQANLDQKLADTEHDTMAMTEELKAIDKMLADSIHPPQPVQIETAKKSGAIANVISLAQRIRALQNGPSD